MAPHRVISIVPGFIVIVKFLESGEMLETMNLVTAGQLLNINGLNHFVSAENGKIGRANFALLTF